MLLRVAAHEAGDGDELRGAIEALKPNQFMHENGNGMKPSPELLQGLNEDLAAEWGTIMRYTFQSAKATGLRGAELREIHEKEIPDELRHARYLTDVISDLGGEPTMEPREWERHTDLKAMLEMDLEKELGDVQNYTKHSRLPGDKGPT